MSDSAGSRHARPEVDLLVCHDCCCGTVSKHPRVDHDDLRARLRACASDRVRVRTVECLDECDRSNVVVVRRHGRPRADRDTWLGDMLEPDDVDALVEWLGAECSQARLPAALEDRRFEHASG